MKIRITLMCLVAIVILCRVFGENGSTNTIATFFYGIFMGVAIMTTVVEIALQRNVDDEEE